MRVRVGEGKVYGPISHVVYPTDPWKASASQLVSLR